MDFFCWIWSDAQELMFYPAKLLNHIGMTFMKLDEIMETD
jgi:hypothetical protein